MKSMANLMSLWSSDGLMSCWKSGRILTMAETVRSSTHSLEPEFEKAFVIWIKISRAPRKDQRHQLVQ